jgi:hypothetical protein
MQIKIKTLTTKIVLIDVEPEYTVKRVKELVQEKEGMDMSFFQFLESILTKTRYSTRTTKIGLFWKSYV